MSNKYSHKPLDSANKSTTNAIKTVSKRAIQKNAKAIGDLIGNKIADKINIRFKTTMLKSSLCDYSDAYIIVKEKVTITGARNDAAARQADERNKGVIF